MSWLLAAIIATLLFGIYPIFADKAGRVHGENISFIIDAMFMAVLAVFLGTYHREDFAKITRASLRNAAVLSLSSVGFFLTLYAIRIAPDKTPIIMAIIGFATIMPAIIYGLMGTKLSVLEWTCISGATFFIVTLCLIQKRV